MSDTPKYCSARLDAERQEALARERQKQSEREARLRQQAEKQHLQRCLEASRLRFIKEIEALQARVDASESAIFTQDRLHLRNACARLANLVQKASDENELRTIMRDTPLVIQNLDEAIHRKQRDEEEARQREEIDRQHLRLRDMDRTLSSVDPGDAAKFDAVGAANAHRAMTAARQAVASAEIHNMNASILRGLDIIRQHRDAVVEGRAEWLQRKAKGEATVGEIAALIEGLAADPILRRWHHASLSQAKLELQQAAQALAEEQFEQPGMILQEIRQRSMTIIQEAGAAQLKADQRDYLTQSIVESLKAMGFVAGPSTLQIPGHPNSARQFSAARGSGRTIHVSVPVEGHILYSVDGYPKSSVATLGGGVTRTCDEAEGALNEMRARLLKEFGVETGEIEWAGKPTPKDTLVSRQVLPTQRSTKR
jgi:hypothetical protein